MQLLKIAVLTIIISVTTSLIQWCEFLFNYNNSKLVLLFELKIRHGMDWLRYMILSLINLGIKVN